MPGQLLPMPIKAQPYAHQRDAFTFVCSLFGIQGGDASLSISSRGSALLMEMHSGHRQDHHQHRDRRGVVSKGPNS